MEDKKTDTYICKEKEKMKQKTINIAKELYQNIENKGLDNSFLNYIEKHELSSDFVNKAKERLRWFYINYADARNDGIFLLSFIVGILTLVLLVISLFDVNFVNGLIIKALLILFTLLFFILYGHQAKWAWRRLTTKKVLKKLPSKYKTQFIEIMLTYSK